MIAKWEEGRMKRNRKKEGNLKIAKEIKQPDKEREGNRGRWRNYDKAK